MFSKDPIEVKVDSASPDDHTTHPSPGCDDPQRAAAAAAAADDKKNAGSSRSKLCAGAKSLWEFAMKDPRRMFHAVKVGLALCLTSLFMLVEEAPQLLGENAIWALMTVVVVFEFTVGATLSKGLNRGLGTLLAAAVGLGVSHLADFCGEIGEASIIIVSIFITGSLATFTRFIPKVKAKYDYGVLIFLLTFSLICVSSYQSDRSFETAKTRMFTILVGCGISLIICMFILPVWAGEDLHNLIARNLEVLAECLEGSVKEYVEKPVNTMQAVMDKEHQNRSDDDEIYVKYRMLLSSNQTEESMATFAGWEPPHGRFFKLRYPWRQYVKVGAALRHCAYASMALHGCLRSEVQAPYELRQVFRTELLRVTDDAVKVMKDLGSNIRSMRKCQPADALLMDLTASTEHLQESIDARSHLFVSPIGMMTKWALVDNPSFEREQHADSSSVPESPYSSAQHVQQHDHRQPSMQKMLGSYRSLSMRSICSASNFSLSTFSSLLIETVARLENVVEEVDSLGQLAKFKAPKEESEKQHEEENRRRSRSSQNLDVHRHNANNPMTTD